MTPRRPEFIALALTFLLLGCGGDVPDASNDLVYYQAYETLDKPAVLTADNAARSLSV